MRKLLLVLYSFIFGSYCFGQIEKGYLLIGGSGVLSNYQQEYTNPSQSVKGKYSEINVSASIGYFIRDKMALGIRPGVSTIKSRGVNSGGGQTQSSIFSLGPFARYYFLNIDKPYNFLIDASFQVGVYTQGISDKDKGTVQNYAVIGGPELFFNSAVGVEFLLGYQFQKKTIKDQVAGFTDIKKGLIFSVGIQVHLKE